MSTLDWLNRDAAFRTAAGVPTRVLRCVRNLDSEPMHAFWLTTSFGRFRPGFVCELTDGRIFVHEYKGDHLRNLLKEIEKAQLGRLWAERSGGQAVFAMLFKVERSMNVTQQIDVAVGAG